MLLLFLHNLKGSVDDLGKGFKHTKLSWVSQSSLSTSTELILRSPGSTAQKFPRNSCLFTSFALFFSRRNFSLVARYSLKFTPCSLIVVKSLVTRCKICWLLIVEVARCKKSLVARCKIRSLLVAEVARCKKSLVTRCKKSLVTRCRSCSFLVAEASRCKKSRITRCKFRSLLVAKIHLLVIALQISIATYYINSLLTRANFS